MSSTPPEPKTEPSGRRRVLVRGGKTLIAIVVVVGLAFAANESLRQWRAGADRLKEMVAEIDRELQQVDDSQRRAALKARREHLIHSLPTPANLDWQRIAVACGVYAIALVPPGLLLLTAVRSFDQPCRVRTAVAAQLLGHVGKYVPGKAMVVVLRVGALSGDGVRTIPATVSVFIETLLMMAVGAAVGGMVVCWLPVPSWIVVAAVGATVVASLPTLPPVLSRVTRYVTHVQPDASPQSGWGVFLAGWGCSLLSWGLIGAAFTLLLSAIPSPQALPPWIHQYPVALAAISLGMVAGFASLLPGGAGVRELVLTAVLAPSVGVAHGLLAAIAARLMFLAVEIVVAAGAWVWLSRHGVSAAIADAAATSPSSTSERSD